MVIDDGLERRLELRELVDVLPQLARQERTVIDGLYFRDESQRQVAHALGVSQMQVSRLHASTIRRPRARLR